MKALNEEDKIANSKTSGYKRTGPQNEAEPLTELKSKQIIRCTWTEGTMQCTSVLESQGLADAHMRDHNIKNNLKIIFCDLCDEEFFSEKDLWKHNQDEHDTSITSNQWNCNNCDFQSTSSAPLMLHCKQLHHQPSPAIQDSRNKLIKCYTCDHEFISYWNLMNHRKETHPSNRKCRNFAKGECKHAELCWYVHDDSVMDHDSEESEEDGQKDDVNYKCYVCDTNFTSKVEVMKHKKRERQINVICKNFLLGNCRRNVQECWYLHQNSVRSVTPSMSPKNINTFPQNPQSNLSSGGSSLDELSIVPNNQNIWQQFQQSVQPSSSSVSLQGGLPCVSAKDQNILSQSQQYATSNSGSDLPQGGPSTMNINPTQNAQTKPTKPTPGFHFPPLNPAPPEIPMMMQQFTQIMNRMENMERNFQMILQNMNPQKYT